MVIACFIIHKFFTLKNLFFANGSQRSPPQSMTSFQHMSNLRHDLHVQTVYGLVELAKFGTVLSVILLEAYKGVERGKHMKTFWIVDCFYNVMRLRLALVYLAFSTEIPSHVVKESISFGLSLAIALAGMFQKPAKARKSGTEFQRMGDTESDVRAESSSRFEGKGEGDASWWSQMLFNWMTPLLVLGRQTQLNDSDLLPLLDEDTCQASGARLNKEWQKVLSHKNEKEPSLFRALVQTFGWSFAVSGLWKIVNDTVVFIGPLMLQSLIRFVEQSDDDKSIMDGAMLALGIFAAKTIETIALGQYFQMGFRIGGQVRSAITHLVYRKAFMLSSRGRQQYKLGEMVSLMSVDATRLCGVIPYLHQFWSAPVQLFISVGLLYNIVGPSVFAGMLLMVLLIPANTWIAQKQTKLNRQIMKIKDEVSQLYLVDIVLSALILAFRQCGNMQRTLSACIQVRHMLIHGFSDFGFLGVFAACQHHG
jgi:hypothetical protein